MASTSSLQTLQEVKAFRLSCHCSKTRRCERVSNTVTRDLLFWTKNPTWSPLRQGVSLRDREVEVLSQVGRFKRGNIRREEDADSSPQDS